jgi:hypothetical protein
LESRSKPGSPSAVFISRTLATGCDSLRGAP